MKPTTDKSRKLSKKTMKPRRAGRKIMKIGIDARFWGLEHAGLGRYVIELVTGLSKIDRQTQYTLFLRKPYDRELKLPKNFKLVLTNILHYSLEEQWLLAEMFTKENLDILHVPHFNVPLLYRKPFIVTIHDLLWHEVKGLSVTTQNPLVYLTKYLGYRAVVRNALRNSQHILVPSKVIREKLVNEHQVEINKVDVTYEAPSNIFKPTRKKTSVLKKYRVIEPYIIYTGSAYPHKNIQAAIEAVKKINDRGQELNLVIASARSVFLDRLFEDAKKLKSEKYIRLVGFVPDYDLVYLFTHALSLIQPSLSEGFGLPGLEAMATGLPVIASDLDVFKEIYRDACLYFDPHSTDEIADKIGKILTDKKLRNSLIKKGKLHAKQFSWKALTRQTLEVYKNVARI